MNLEKDYEVIQVMENIMLIELCKQLFYIKYNKELDKMLCFANVLLFEFTLVIKARFLKCFF